MPSWDQLMQLLDKVGLCGVIFLLLMIHMIQEEAVRRGVVKTRMRRDFRRKE